MDENERSVFENFIKKYAETSKKTKGVAKTMTLAILGVVVAFGIVGSFSFFKFNMNNYVLFLEKFAILYTPLILSIGGGKIAETVAKKKEEKKEKENTEEEPPVASGAGK